MKRFFLFSLLGFVWMAFVTVSLPDAPLKDMRGHEVRFLQVVQNGNKPVVVSFWATWCVPCIKELDAIADVYPDWQDETGVKLVAISVDDARTAGRIKSLVNGRGWDYEVYHDYKGELKEKLHIRSVPYLMVIHKGRIVYTRNSYNPGDEESLYQLLKKLQ